MVKGRWSVGGMPWAIVIVPRMRRSDDWGMKRQDSIRCLGISFSLSKPWRAVAFHTWAWRLFLFLCTFYGSPFFL